MSDAARPLTREDLGVHDVRPRARVVHFGLGAFHRAHQAWFSAHAGDGAHWGICAFTGRGSGLAAALARQDGLYTLIVRSASEDRFEVMTNLVEVHEGGDCAAIADVVSRPEVVIMTTTVTEAGYRLGLDGAPRDDPELAGDLAALRVLEAHAGLDDLELHTVPGRILLGLEARRRADAGPIALVPCDNVPNNGEVLRRGLTELAHRVSTELAGWVAQNVSFVATSVDRITPRTTAEDVALVRERTGWIDAAPVVTEPFASWVLAGDFPAGRPRWEDAGAQFVTAIEPYERRKLWLLNGAHSILAYRGLDAGHVTVAEAVADPLCRRSVESFWSSAVRQLPEGLDLAAYRAQLIERFENARMGYRLEQIATDSVMKLRTRIAPVVVAEYRAGRDCPAGVEVIAAWVRRLLHHTSFPDAEGAALRTVLDAEPVSASALIRLIDPRLVELGAFVDAVSRLVAVEPDHTPDTHPSTRGEE